MKKIEIQTPAHTAFVNITAQVQATVAASGISQGTITAFVPHTTAGITINESADPDVRTDLENILAQAVPWQGRYRHLEGNAAAHAKASLMGSSVQLLVVDGQLQLGVWQAIYFCEFDGPRSRQVW
ncbi:MAG: YjbQ family protein, partial [Lentisphaerae bacterium]|nr:YjbQ family protein [Lentisphaerota bacterium]